MTPNTWQCLFIYTRYTVIQYAYLLHVLRGIKHLAKLHGAFVTSRIIKLHSDVNFSVWINCTMYCLSHELKFERFDKELRQHRAVNQPYPKYRAHQGEIDYFSCRLDDIRLDNVLVPMQCTRNSGCFPRGKRAATVRRYPVVVVFPPIMCSAFVFPLVTKLTSV